MKHNLIRTLALLLLVSLVLFSLAGESTGLQLLKIPDEATAKTLDGKTVSLADHKGKLIFLNVWSTGCPGCIIEIPVLNELQKKQGSDTFTVIGLSLDRGKDKQVAEFVKQANVAYPVWLSYGQPIFKYTAEPLLPTLLIISPEGELLAKVVGAFTSYEQAANILQQARAFAEQVERVKAKEQSSVKSCNEGT